MPKDGAKERIICGISACGNNFKADKDGLACFNFSERDLEHIEDWKVAVCLDYYLLCFEDLDSKYTVKDEKKYSDCKAGTFKRCHRTILVKVLKEKYGLKINEWGEILRPFL